MDRKPEEDLRDILEVAEEEGAEDVEQQPPISYLSRQPAHWAVPSHFQPQGLDLP